MKARISIGSLEVNASGPLPLFLDLAPSQHPRERDAMKRPKGITRALDALMADGKLWTVSGLAGVLRRRGYRFTESGLTARIRDLRKRPFSRTVTVTEGDGDTLYRVGV